jgi:NAD(P)H dehydrogenase (quinone)
MKIVVTTPTGNVGSRVVRLLLQAGVRPTLLMRHPDKLDAETAAHVDVVQADQLVADDVLRATEGADAMYWVDPPADVDTDPVAHYERAGSHAAGPCASTASRARCSRAASAPRSARARERSTGSLAPSSS